MAKIAVFIGDFFWASIPYDGLTLFKHLKAKGFDVELLMFAKDIRVNKSEFRPNEKFYFDRNLFLEQNPVLLTDWQDLFARSKNYALMIGSAHLFPKIRRPEDMFPGLRFHAAIQCRFMTIDIGGTDVFNTVNRSNYICVKGPVWADWLAAAGFDKKNVFVTGTPHYDAYLHGDKLPPEARPLDKREFCKKYGLLQRKKNLLIAPSNPGSHREQFAENMKTVGALTKLGLENNHQVLIKTYPSDYLFYETSNPYTGVYHRTWGNGPQHALLQKRLKSAVVVEAQDHFAALMYSDRMYNMSGSHLAWETYLCGCHSFAINYRKQPYYGGASYLPDVVKLPDDRVNTHVGNVEEIFGRPKADKQCSPYISLEFSLDNIAEAVKKVV